MKTFLNHTHKSETSHHSQTCTQLLWYRMNTITGSLAAILAVWCSLTAVVSPEDIICKSDCPSSYYPVCGSDGHTYVNKCAFEAAACNAAVSREHIQLRNLGACGSVCGENLQTYETRCAFDAAVCRAKREGKELMVKHAGRCVECKQLPGSDICTQPPITTVTWYKQEKSTSMYIRQDNLPALTALTLCFRFKPLVLNHNNKQGKKYITSISDPVKPKRWNLGIKTNPSLAFGISPSSYFTDGENNEEENDLWKQEHKHCFVWQRKPGPFKWFADNDPTKPGQLVLFRTVSSNKVTTIKAGGTIKALQEQDITGGGNTADQVTPGWIAQYNMYDYAMSDAQVLRMNVFCTEKGNLVNEETFTIVGGMEKKEEMFACPASMNMIG